MKLINKNLDNEFDNEEVSASIQNTYEDATVERFKKRDGKVLNTEGFSFTRKTSFHKAKVQGVFIKNKHHQSEEHIDRPSAIQCYHCQKFGQKAKFCGNKQRCAKCSVRGQKIEACLKVT